MIYICFPFPFHSDLNCLACSKHTSYHGFDDGLFITELPTKSESLAKLDSTNYFSRLKAEGLLFGFYWSLGGAISERDFEFTSFQMFTI